MTDKNGNDDKGEEVKRWERELSWRNAFLDQWRTELAPIDAMIALGTQSATKFALTGLRSGYLLNGGALIALPAFIEIFNKFKPGDTVLTEFMAIPFVIGLIASAIANFLGYKCVNTAVTAQEELRSWRSLQVTQLYFPSKDKVSTAKKVKLSKDKCDVLFRKTRNEEKIGIIFFISSLSFFVIGVIYSLSTWLGIERIFAMEEPSFIIKLLGVLAWPAATVLIVMVLRKPILTLMGRWRGGNGLGSGGSEPILPGQDDPGGSSTEKQLSETQTDPVPAVENQVKILRRQLDEAESTLNINRETALLRALARSNLREHFERTYRHIWGSQLHALQKLNSVVTSNTGVLKPFYDLAATQHPSVYENYSFDEWLRFLEGQSLLILRDDIVEITMEGQEFLKYLVDQRLDTDKLG